MAVPAARPRRHRGQLTAVLAVGCLLLAACTAGSGQRSGRHRWVPAPGTTWQVQFTGTVDTGVAAEMYDLDSVGASAALVARLHAAGRRVICYLNAGAAEDFRPDRAAFPDRVLGRGDGWPGERYLDIRQREVLRPIMAARMDLCRSKGFDGVDADVLDGYADRTGFALTAADQLAYNRMLARLAHRRGLSIGLKNDLRQVPELVGDFDFAIDEQCVQYRECRRLLPFVRAGKAVFHIEYDLATARFCPLVTRLGFSSIRKNRDLDAARWPCPVRAGASGR